MQYVLNIVGVLSLLSIMFTLNIEGVEAALLLLLQVLGAFILFGLGSIVGYLKKISELNETVSE